MGARLPFSFSNTTLTGTIVTTTDTLVVTSAPIIPSYDNQAIIILGQTNIQLGTSATSYTLRLRRGNLITSTQIYLDQPYFGTAGQFICGSIVFIDLPGSVSAQQYSLSVVSLTATGNATVGSAQLLVMAL